jgi:hypothetical protein
VVGAWGVLLRGAAVDAQNFAYLGRLGPWTSADLKRGARRYTTVAAALDYTHVQESIARPIGKLYKTKSLVRVVPFDYGLDRGTRGCFKPLRTRSGCRSETAPGCFEVVVIEAAAPGRAKLSVSAAHVIP